MTYRGFGYVVDSCPTNETEFISAATRLNCIEDQYGRNQYTCVPNEEKSTLVEFCYSQIVAFYQKGHCLVTTGNGTLDQISCKEFKTGCPEEDFRGNGLYNFSACSRINTENQCFYANPSCPNTTKSITFDQSTTVDFLKTTTNVTMEMLTTETGAGSEDSRDLGVTLGIILGLLLLLSLAFAFIFWKRWKSRKRYQRVPLKDPLLVPETNEENANIQGSNSSEVESIENDSSLELVESYKPSKMFRNRENGDENEDSLMKRLYMRNFPYAHSQYTGPVVNPNEHVNSGDLSMISEEMSTRFKYILCFLDMQHHDIDQDKGEHEPFQSKIYQTLLPILNKDPAITRQIFCNALNYAGHSDVIEMLNSRWGTKDSLLKKRGSIEEIENFSNADYHNIGNVVDPTDRIHKWDFFEIREYLAFKSNALLRFFGIYQRNEEDEKTEGEIYRILLAIHIEKPSLTRQTFCNALGYAGYFHVIKFLNSTWSTGDSKRDFLAGPYSAWKTPISDHICALTNEDICVLFCFLCYDSGFRNFNDVKLLDILNKIRWYLCHFRDPVTREEAEQTLEALKAHDVLWSDQTKEQISKDAQDEIIHLVQNLDDSGFTLYFFSSFTTLQKYLRLSGYQRKLKEKCIISSNCVKDLELIKRLQMNALIQTAIGPGTLSNWTTSELMIERSILRGTKNEREFFFENLKMMGKSIRPPGKELHLKFLWRYKEYTAPDIVRSCIGLYPHWDIYIIDNMAYSKQSCYHKYRPAVRCLLYCLLLVDQYTFDVEKQTHEEVYNKIRAKYFTDLPSNNKIDASDFPEDILYRKKNTFTFKLPDIKHEVMYSFVTECLLEYSDMEFFLEIASYDVIWEYCRSRFYKRNEGERCLYIPYIPPPFEDSMHDLFIDKLGLDIITHCTILDPYFPKHISQRLKIPKEVMKWDINARKRFVEMSRKGLADICRARGMIVGCAGAGKTTLLQQLKRTKANKSPPKSTVGLDIHEDLFGIRNDTLIDLKQEEEDAQHSSTESKDKEIISMTDFAGQVAYYACHQIYLSKRAFYLVVMDMSKRLGEVVHTQDTDRHNPKGSLFHGWTYTDYFRFWLQSIKTYCEDEKAKNAKANPVIIIATHHDCIKGEQEIVRALTFYDQLEESLPGEHTLNGLICKERYYEIECPEEGLNEHQETIIENVRKCIVHTVRSLSHWGEKIPLIWITFEQFVREYKEEKKIISRKELQEKEEFRSLKEDEVDDMLRYFKDIGLIIYFAEKGLKKNIILDVQWFVDAFKNIITDPTHAKPHCERFNEWKKFTSTGRIQDLTLVKIWEEKPLYTAHKKIIIPYMQKLGILAILGKSGLTGKRNDKDMTGGKKELVYYIPSLNKTEFSEKAILEIGNKTPVLVFFFKTYIPHFFFFRLVAICFSKWEPLGENLLCKNVAFYKDKGGDRHIAIAVNKTSIQLQVFTPGKAIHLNNNKTKEIRSNIEEMMDEITSTFHQQVLYEVGYPCRNINITEEDEDCFLSEKTVAELTTNRRICPNYVPPTKHEEHDIVRDDLLYYWYTDPEKLSRISTSSSQSVSSDSSGYET